MLSSPSLAGGGAEAGIQLLRTHQSAAAAEYYSSDTEPPGGFHSASRDDSDDDGDDDEGALLHSRVVDDEVGGHESGDEYGAEPGTSGDGVSSAECRGVHKNGAWRAQRVA